MNGVAVNVVSPPPASLLLEKVVLLNVEAGTRFAAVVNTELQRYPTGIRIGLPAIWIVESATHEGSAVGARYFAGEHCGVLAPRLDLRGNVHRLIAASLMSKHPESAALLLSELREIGESGRLYERGLSEVGHAAALVGAVVGARPSLADARRRSAELERTLSAAETFLGTVGIDDVHRRGLPPAPPYAFLTALSGDGRVCTILPDGIDVTFSAPSSTDFPTSQFTALSDAEVPLARRSVTRALWTIPEGVLGDAVRHVYVVEDVRYDDGTDIAGFASGYDGASATIVLEHQQGRQILHHEFGHALHFRHHEKFPEAEWKLLVPSSGGYLGSTKKFRDSEVSLPPFSSDLLRRGFVTAYGSSTFHEDVAEYLEALLGGDPRLWAALPGAPLVEAKLSLLINFLHDIDPTFTRDHLERLCTERPLHEAMWGH